MVQLAENTTVPPRAAAPPHPGLPHPPSSMTQPQQLTGDITTAAAVAAQLGRPPPSPAAVAPQLASNGSQKTHSRPSTVIPEVKNGYTDHSQPLVRGVTRRREQGGSSRRDAGLGHVRLKKDAPDSLYPHDRWSYYNDPRVKTDQAFLWDDHRYRRWSREGDGSSWSARDRQTPVDSRSFVSEAGVVKDGVKTEGGEGLGVGGGGESRRRPPPHQHDSLRAPRTLPKHYRDRDQERERVRDAGERERDRDRDHGRERDRDRDRENTNSERDLDRERERDRNRERDRDRDRERERDRDHHREPRRREPVGEETGYDSDHSRLSRTTAISYSSRSLPRRPRADSVASHASHTRTPARPRGYEDMYEQYRHYYYNQYYKDYYDWMKQCHKSYPSESFYDDRTSIHSGRSSVNNEPEKSVSSQFLQDFHGTSGLGHFEPSPIYPEGSLSQLKSYPSGELSGVPSVGDDTVSEAAQRMTPVHFGRPHICARFTPSGQLVLVLPKDPRDGEKAVVQLRDVQKMLCVDPTESRVIQQMKCYPGPLTLSDTHKDVVMRHCEHQAAEAGKSLTLLDRESVMLIWEYLALLVKQNGKLFGSDVARLLLKGQEVGYLPTHTSPHAEEPPEDEPSDTSPQDEGIDLPSQSPAAVQARDESALLRKFTEYLCLGRKKEAVDYAIREGLWGHALALAYKMDSTTHTRVLSAFMSHIPHTDVVLTLFQQLSGKKPEITKSYNPEQWGDWRQHLAVMISNPTGASHKDHTSIVALGDILAAQGQLHAAHFCYLVAEVEWGSYTLKDSKLVLIGASHHLPFQAFATIEAIQCTEVYEFACSLDGNSNPLLETFQSYKLVYALKLTECGFPAEALRYCEVITQSVEKNPTAYKVEFLSQVYGLACRLKYHDLHYQMYQGEVSEIPDPKWLANLRSMLDTARQQEHQQLMELQDTTRTDDDHSYPQMYHQDQGRQDINQTVAVDPNYSMAEHSQTHSHHMETRRMGYNAPGQPYQQPDSLYTSQPTSDVPDNSHYAASPHSPSKSVEATPMNPSHSQGVMGLPQEEGPSAVEAPMMPQPSPEHSHYPQDTTSYQGTYQKQEPYMQRSSQSPITFEQSGGGGEQQQNMSSDTSLSLPGGQGGYPSYQQQQQSYQPWGQPQPAEGGGMPPQPDAPPRSPEPPATQQRTPEEEAYWAEMSNKKGGSDSSSKEDPSKEDKSEENKRSSAGKESKASSANKGGWLTNLLGWKSSTPQAVLPDDKNPKIVWDEKRKTWVNTDGSEEATHAVGPPPKIPQAIRVPPPFVSRSGNRMTRYVDPVREKSGGAARGAQPAPVLSAMPMNSPSVSPSLIVPPPMQPTQEDTEAGDNPSQPQSQPRQQPSAPAPAPVPEAAQMRRTRYISESSIELEDDWPPAKTEGTLNEEVRGPVPMMAPPMGQPQFFDPSQFKPASGTPTNPARRTGPGRRSFPANR